MKPLLLIGPVCLDTNKYNNKDYKGIGGAVYYQCRILDKLNISYEAQVTLSANDSNLLEYLSCVKPIFKEDTIKFSNIYKNNKRIQYSNFSNTPINYDDLILDKQYSGIVLNPLVKTDFPLDTIKKLSKLNNLYLSIQGLLRVKTNNNQVKLEYNKHLPLIFKYIHTVFLDKTEALIVSGSDDIFDSIKFISSLGPEEVVVTLEDKGSLIYNKNLDELVEIPSFKVDNVINPTGAGDTYMISYIIRRLQGENIKNSGNYASKIASYKIKEKL